MAVVQCEICLLVYDDTYRLTWCPHDGFDMATMVVRGDGCVRVCTSLAEFWDFIEAREQDTDAFSFTEREKD